MHRFHSLSRPARLVLRFLGAFVFTATLLLALVAALGIWPARASAAPAAQGPAFDCATVSEIPEAECQALVSLYNGTDGSRWITNTHWLQTLTPCSWYGVTCSVGHVTRLYFRANHLSGTIPPDLASLAELTELTLGDNVALTYEIPKELGNLTNLVRLELFNNALTGTIPPALGNLTNLQVLNLSMNPLQEGPIPAELTRFEQLRQFWLASSNRTGPIPDLTGLENLTNLHLGNNQLTGPVPDLSGLKKLKWAAMGINRLSGSIPASLAMLSPTLEALHLNYNQLTGPVPQELCALTKTGTTTVYIDHNALDLAPAPLCPQVIDPSWTWTQTLPPTDIQATALSTSSIRLSWSPIAYQADGGGYQVLLSTTRGDPSTYSGVVTDLVKSTTGYTVTNLAAGTTYHFAVRTRTPPMPVPGAGFQRNELWSPYSPQVSAQTRLPAAGTLITLKKEPEAGEPVSAAEVLAYRGAITVAQGTTNAHGQVILDGLQAGDSILARSLQHEQPSAKGHHHTGSEPDWSYRVYLTNLDIGPTGTVTKTVIEEPGLAVTTTLKKDNTLVLFNLVVSTDFPATPAVLSFLQDEFTRASTFLYDVTDGQFALGQVAVYDHALIDDDDADVLIANSDPSQPDSKMGGIVATEVFTYTSSAQRQTIYSPGYFRIPMGWDSNRPDPVCDGFCRSLIHEFAHYALFLYDEYERTTADGETVKTHCTSPDIQTSTSTQPSYASNASIMYEPYKTSELAMQGTPQWSTFCKDTLQWQIHGESDWETIVGVYADNEESPESPRWQFKTPLTLGHANPGPESVPIDFTTLRVYDAPPPGIEAPAPGDVSMSPGKQMRVFLFSMQHGHLQSIAEVGAPITDTIRAFGLLVGDELKAFTTDGSEYASQTLTSQDQPFVLQPGPWRPLLEAKPDARGEGLELTVSGAEDVSGDLQAMLVAAGGAYSTTTTLSGTGIGEYRGFLPFGQGRSRREGYVWVWGQAQDDTRLEAVTTYRVEGAPGSHEWAYLDWEVGSLDRLLSLSLPENAVPTNTLIIVMPVFQLPPLVTGTSALLSAVGASSPQLGRQDVRTFEGTAHRIWASGEMKKRSALTLFYDPTINPSLNSAYLSIYYYNESESALGRGKVGWEEVGGVVDRERHSVSAPVTRFGIYALVKEFRSYLPIIVR